jgi:hypothetical protein
MNAHESYNENWGGVVYMWVVGQLVTHNLMALWMDRRSLTLVPYQDALRKANNSQDILFL